MIDEKQCRQALKDLTFHAMHDKCTVKYSDEKKKFVLKDREQRQHDLLSNLIDQYFAMIKLFGFDKQYERVEFDEEEFKKSLEKYHQEMKEECNKANKQNIEKMKEQIKILERQLKGTKIPTPTVSPYRKEEER